jgi:hypothetical protein
MRVTGNPEIGVFVRISNPSGFFVQPDRGGGAVVTGQASHARNHVFVVQSDWEQVSGASAYIRRR